MNLGSIYGKLDHKDRCHIISILNTYSHEYTVICRAHNVKNAIPMIVFFDKKKVLKYLKSWHRDYDKDYPFGDRVMFDRVTRIIDIMS